MYAKWTLSGQKLNDSETKQGVIQNLSNHLKNRRTFGSKRKRILRDSTRPDLLSHMNAWTRYGHDALLVGIKDNLLVRNRSQLDGAGLIFIVASGLMMAHQVAGKAVRDGLFLSRFAPRDLPKVVVAAALAAVLLGLGFARILGRSGPLRVVPLSFAVGSFLHLAEYAMLQGAGEDVRAVVITIVYLHLVGFGAILLSGFWSIVNEFFDPREAKLRFGRIAGAGTLGAIAGGLLVERGAALFGV